MEEVRIDVRDLDYTWFEDVRAYLDRDADCYYLPKESADRLGEPDDDSADYFLIDGRVEAFDMGRGAKTLADEIADLEAQTKIEDELAQLKAGVAHRPAKA